MHWKKGFVMRVALVAWACFFLVCSPEAQSQEQSQPRTGAYEMKFSERSPGSNPQSMAKIAHWPLEQIKDYDLADHSFQVVVPEAYDGSEAYGLIVFIHPNERVTLENLYARSIADSLANQKLIWVSFDKAGNTVLSNVRMGLALDAVHNLVKQYRINEDRVYVSGLSGGGRLSCMSAIYYPQVFKGAIPIVGSMYFRDVKLPQDPELRRLIRADGLEGKTVWPRGLIEPGRRILDAMKSDQRWVLITGDKDFNMPEMRAHFEQGFERDGFEHVTYMEIQGMGHEYPDAVAFDKAITLLDEPLSGRPNPDLPPADEKTQLQAQHRLEVAIKSLEKEHARGVMMLKRLIKDFPNTEAANTAWQELEKLGEN